MQSIMYHPKCHSFSNTIIRLLLGDGQKKVVQAIHQHCHYVIFLSNLKTDCKRSQASDEKKNGRQCYQSWFSYMCSIPLLFCVLRYNSTLTIK